MTTRITVAIPAYNAAAFLAETLESVLNQTSAPDEVLVVDDGSSDGTGDVVAPYGDRVRYIRQANQGIAGARNTCIAEATGDWIALFDHDDIALPRKIELQRKMIDANPELMVVYSGFTYLYGDGGTLDVAAYPSQELWPGLRYRTPILPSTAIIRRSALLEVGGFNGSPLIHMIDDWDMWLRLVRRYSAKAFREVPECLTLYRWGEGNTSRHTMRRLASELALMEISILEGTSGLERELLRRRLEAKFFYNASLELRERGDRGYWELMIQSLLRWPFAGRVVSAHRYRVALKMLWTRLKGDERLAAMFPAMTSRDCMRRHRQQGSIPPCGLGRMAASECECKRGAGR